MELLGLFWGQDWGLVKGFAGIFKRREGFVREGFDRRVLGVAQGFDVMSDFEGLPCALSWLRALKVS